MKSKNWKRIVHALAFISIAGSAHALTDISSCQIISLPGSYRLTQNLVASGTCLDIRASGVSIDLAGHEIRGAGNGTAIRANFSPRNLAVRNGTISNFGVGVDFRSVSGGVIERLRISEISDGIRATSVALITANIVRGARTNGITVDGSGVSLVGSVIADNIVEGSGQNGISVGTRGNVVRGNAVAQNANVGIFVQCPSTVIGNAANNNGTSVTSNLVLFGTGCLSSQNATGQ